jgi:hypothetical protein
MYACSFIICEAGDNIYGVLLLSFLQEIPADCVSGVTNMRIQSNLNHRQIVITHFRRGNLKRNGLLL